MARAEIKHSSDGVTVMLRGDVRRPEPSTGVIRFPGGHVEVSRTSGGDYWAHVNIDSGAEIVSSRIDYKYEKWRETAGEIPDIPAHADIQRMCLLVRGDFVVSWDERE